MRDHRTGTTQRPIIRPRPSRTIPVAHRPYDYYDYPRVAYTYDDYDYVMTVDTTGEWAWIPGYWEWQDGDWYWVSGYWTAMRVGYYWQPGYWTPNDGAYRRIAGRWIRQSQVSEHRRPRIEVRTRGSVRVPARRGGRY